MNALDIFLKLDELGFNGEIRSRVVQDTVVQDIRYWKIPMRDIRNLVCHRISGGICIKNVVR